MPSGHFGRTGVVGYPERDTGRPFNGLTPKTAPPGQRPFSCQLRSATSTTHRALVIEDHCDARHLFPFMLSTWRQAGTTLNLFSADRLAVEVGDQATRTAHDCFGPVWLGQGSKTYPTWRWLGHYSIVIRVIHRHKGLVEWL